MNTRFIAIYPLRKQERVGEKDESMLRQRKYTGLYVARVGVAQANNSEYTLRRDKSDDAGLQRGFMNQAHFHGLSSFIKFN